MGQRLAGRPPRRPVNVSPPTSHGTCWRRPSSHSPRGGLMNKSREYRDHAEECRALARNAQNEEQRRQLLELAESWGSLALEREQRAERHPMPPSGRDDR